MHWLRSPETDSALDYWVDEVFAAATVEARGATGAAHWHTGSGPPKADRKPWSAA